MVNDQQSCESKKKMAFKSYEIKVPLKGWSKPVKNNLS